jgi:hypothetical protein
MEENRHEWDVVIKGTKEVFYCLVGDCVNILTRSKLSGLNLHCDIIHNLPPIPPCPRGRLRYVNAKRIVKSPSKAKRRNEKIHYDVDARLCCARKHAYKIFVNG